MDGGIYDLKSVPELNKNTKHTIEVVVDRLILREAVRPRLNDSLEAALRLSDGLAIIVHEDAAAQPPVWRDSVYSATYACPDHPEVNLPELAPRMFSFNSPYGACEACDGLGTILEFDPELIVPDKTLPLSQGAIDAWRHGGKRMNIFYNRQMRMFCRETGVSPERAVQGPARGIIKKLLYGD